QEPGSITCQVADQGIGIAAEELERIFERGYRVRSKETDRSEGTGAGLAIVKTIVEKHGGKVFVSSTPGEGSVFGFTLPTA
nr:HAMP domain-containing histidine kinase [Anaerolineae bacterium]